MSEGDIVVRGGNFYREGDEAHALSRQEVADLCNQLRRERDEARGRGECPRCGYRKDCNCDLCTCEEGAC